jgi:hypothetical protein
MSFDKVRSQQAQIDELRRRLEELEAQLYGWQSVSAAADSLGVSTQFIRQRLKRSNYKKAGRRLGRNWSVNLQIFKAQLAQEKQ